MWALKLTRWHQDPGAEFKSVDELVKVNGVCVYVFYEG